MADQHAPAPWMTHGQYVITGTPGPAINALSEADAEFIVRAVNWHAELLAALEGLTGQYVAFVSQGAAQIHNQGDREAFQRFHDGRLNQAIDALRKARGEDA